MNLTEWRKLRTEGEAATLPSGLDVRLKRVGAMDLAERSGSPGRWIDFQKIEFFFS
jgi:hypothetical protein